MFHWNQGYSTEKEARWISLKPRVFDWEGGLRPLLSRNPWFQWNHPASSSVETLGFNEITFSFNFWTLKNHETANLLLKFLRNRQKERFPFKTLSVYLRFHDFLGVQKLKLKVVSLKPRVSTEKEGRWFHWNQGFRLRRRLGGFIETKGFDWEGGRRPSFSVEYPWFQWIPPNLLLSWIPLVSMKSTCPPSQSNTLGFYEIYI